MLQALSLNCDGWLNLGVIEIIGAGGEAEAR